MISFPNCKINLGLTVTGKRPDGYHQLETIFYPVELRDVLEIITNQSLPDVENSSRHLPVQFSGSGLPIAGNPADNLCVLAYGLLKKDFPSLPPVIIHLHKTIPMGSGLGGGSSDGAFTLRLLNNKYQLGLTQEQLIDYAASLGSDCPFFIINKPSYATGRGEIMERVAVDLSAYTLVLVNSGIHINTGWAFRQLVRTENDLSANKRMAMKELVQQPVSAWKNELVNDFELPVFRAYPSIREIRDHLYASGAVYAAMSGSGSTVFGIFAPGDEPKLSFPAEYRVKTLPPKGEGA